MDGLGGADGPRELRSETWSLETEMSGRVPCTRGGVWQHG